MEPGQHVQRVLDKLEGFHTHSLRHLFSPFDQGRLTLRVPTLHLSRVGWQLTFLSLIEAVPQLAPSSLAYYTCQRKCHQGASAVGPERWGQRYVASIAHPTPPVPRAGSFV
eukprot:2342005-Pyramimonas_sp.AAC.1